MVRKVQTVLGQIEPYELGRTLTHEHLENDFNQFYTPAPDNVKNFFDGNIELQNLGFIRQYPYASKDNMTFSGSECNKAVLYDIDLYKKLGGGSIVENSSHGLKRNINLMTQISMKTGVHIISGTGYYVAAVQSPSILTETVESLTNTIMKEMTDGCVEQPEVKCGFIGEVGSSWPIHEFEKRAIEATAEAQLKLKCPVSFHPGRDAKAPFEILRIFQEAGGDVKKTIMSHLDRTILEDSVLCEFAAVGSYCQFDLFGTECSFYQLNPPLDMPSDAQRLNKVQLLISEGKEDKILLSHDIHTKHRLIKYGGHGYSHIINNIVPKMKIKGISQATIDKITIENPQEWLSFDI